MTQCFFSVLRRVMGSCVMVCNSWISKSEQTYTLGKLTEYC